MAEAWITPTLCVLEEEKESVKQNWGKKVTPSEVEGKVTKCGSLEAK